MTTEGVRSPGEGQSALGSVGSPVEPSEEATARLGGEIPGGDSGGDSGGTLERLERLAVRMGASGVDGAMDRLEAIWGRLEAGLPPEELREANRRGGAVCAGVCAGGGARGGGAGERRGVRGMMGPQSAQRRPPIKGS
jgi:hypothetical protein